jgi:hypothetical protein
VKDNLKGQQQWQQRPVRMDSGPKQQGFQYPQFQGPVVDNWNRMQQEQKIDVVATTANVPAFNMQQKVMAAPALQVCGKMQKPVEIVPAKLGFSGHNQNPCRVLIFSHHTG